MKNVTSNNTYNVRDCRGEILQVGDYVALATPRGMKTGKVRGFKSTDIAVVDCVKGYALSYIQYPMSNLLKLDNTIADAVEYDFNMGKRTRS